MAEAMISDQCRESLQSLERFAAEQTEAEIRDEQRLAQQRQGSDKEVGIDLVNQSDDDCIDKDSEPNKRVSHDTRTVIIEIPAQKRRKVSTSITTQQILEAISTAVTHDERREAIGTATSCFDHNEQALHDEEVKSGADAILTKHIGFLLSQEQLVYREASSPNPGHQLSCACEALEMVLRASPGVVSQSFTRLGRDLMAIMIHLINYVVESRLAANANADGQTSTSEDNSGSSIMAVGDSSPVVQATTQPTAKDVFNSPSTGSIGSSSSQSCPAIVVETSADARRNFDVTLRKASKVLGHFARVRAVTQPMAYFPGLLPCLIRVLMVSPSAIRLPAESRLNSLWIIANLACNTENMVMMACQPNLIAALVHMASRRLQPGDPPEVAVEVFRSQSIASRALVNLSWAPENRIPMSENDGILQTLSVLAAQRESPFGKKGRTIQDLILQSRRHAVGTLHNLASAPRRCKIQLCYSQQGLLLDQLADAAFNDPDAGIREKALSTIHHLAHYDTADMMVSRPTFVMALKNILLSERASGKTEDTAASKMLKVLQRSISPQMNSFQALKKLIEEVKPETSSNNGMFGTSNSIPPSFPTVQENHISRPGISSSSSSIPMEIAPKPPATQVSPEGTSNRYMDEEGNIIVAEAL